jgi:hypothetical protein
MCAAQRGEVSIRTRFGHLDFADQLLEMSGKQLLVIGAERMSVQRTAGLPECRAGLAQAFGVARYEEIAPDKAPRALLLRRDRQSKPLGGGPEALRGHCLL